MRHATSSLRSFVSPAIRWAAWSLAVAPAVLLIPSARGEEGAAPAPAAAAPATQPVPPEAAPAQPLYADAVPAAPAEAKPSKILITTFGIVGGRPGDTWLGRSIQQSVLVDLLTAGTSHVTTTTDSPADAAAARELGRKLGARYVIFGQVHVNSANNLAVRVTGEILAPEAERPAAVLKATGSMNDLFPLEDLLGNQARSAMGRLQLADARAGNAANPANNAAVPAEPAEPPVIEPSGPVQAPYSAVPDAPYYAPYPVVGAYPASAGIGYDPYPVYSYPDYGFGYYPYGYCYSPGIIIGGFGFAGRGVGFHRGFGSFGSGAHFGGRFGGIGRIGGAGHIGGVGHVGGVGHIGGGVGRAGGAGGVGHGGGHR